MKRGLLSSGLRSGPRHCLRIGTPRQVECVGGSA